MPKNKFNNFYYGIGMKLDEASVDKAGQQLEGRLNQVVDKITQKVATMTDAIAKGAKNIDATELVKDLAEAQRELVQFQDFDPSKLQRQLDSLSQTVGSLGDQFEEISGKLKAFTDDVTSRLSNIEIRTSKQGKDALKRDLKQMRQLAQGYSDVMAKGVKIDTSELDEYIKKIKAGLASLKNSGNPMEMFADNELAHDFVAITKILRQMGVSADSLRGDFYELSSVFKGIFEKSSAKGAQTIFKDVGYQIEAVTAKLRKAQSDLARYEDHIAKVQSRTKSTGFDITVESDKNLDLDQKIARIQEYGDIIAELDYGEAWATATKNQIALIQAAEKELQSLLKTSRGQEALAKWQTAFGKYDLTDKLSTGVIADYVDGAQKELEALQRVHKQTKAEIEAYEADLGKLRAREEVTASVKKAKRATKSATQKQKAEGVVAEVDAKIKINEKEWQRAINTAVRNVETKVKPFKLKVEATSGNILKEVKKIRDASLVDARKTGDADVKAFNNRFDKFYGNLRKRREEIIEEIKTNWHPALKDAFTFRMELLGIDNKSMTQNIGNYILSTVDVINDTLETKPIEFHSNIDTLIEEIQSKLSNIKIDSNIGLDAGNITVTPQSLSNVGIILGNISQGSGSGAPIQPIVPSSIPQISKTTSVDIQEIYNSIADVDWKTLTLDSVKDAAQKLEKRLIDAEEGTEEYYRAQIELAKLLGAWRYKIGGSGKGKEAEIKGIMGTGKNVKAKWEKYLKDNAILADPTNARILSKSQIGSQYGIDTKAVRINKKSSKTTELTLEEITTTRLENGKKAIQYFISLAKLGKSLSSIREIADKPITANMFNDGRIEQWVRGHKYTKEDIGSYAPGKKLTPEALGEFLSMMGISEADLGKSGRQGELQKLVNTLKQKGYRTAEEETQLKEAMQELQLLQAESDFLTPLKQYIYTFMQQRQQLNNLVQELSNSPKASIKSVAQGYLDAGGDSTAYLVDEFSDILKKLVVKTPKTQAQKVVSQALADAGIDLSEFFKINDPNKKFEFLQNQLLNRRTYTIGSGDTAFNVPWEQWIKKFSRSGLGANYEKFFTLLQLGREYSGSYNALSQVGREANMLVSGESEREKAERRRWNNETAQYDYVEKEVNKVIRQGIRGMLKSLQAVFEDEAGRTLLGYNLGKGYISDDDFLGANSSFTKIINALTEASNNASRILFGSRSSFADSSNDVDRWTPPSKTRDSSINEYQFTKAITEKKQIEEYIDNINAQLNGAQQTYNHLKEQLSALISKDDVAKVTQLQSQADSKQAAINEKGRQISEENRRIEDLQRNLTNPEPLYEDILKSLLEEETQLAKIEAEIAHKSKNKKTYNDELAIGKLVEEKTKIQNRIANLQSSIGVAALGTDDQKINAEIEKETAEIAKLEAEVQKYQDADKQSEKAQIEQEIARKQKYIENLNTALNSRARARTKDSIEAEIAERQKNLITLQNEWTQLNNELTTLNTELEKFGSPDNIKQIVAIIREQQAILANVRAKQALLAEYNKQLPTADKKKVVYDKTYGQAVANLPVAQANKKLATEDLKLLQTEYQAEWTQAAAEIANKYALGEEVSATEVKKVKESLLDIAKLNEQLQKGEISRADYIKKLSESYIAMRNATTDEAKAGAKADAERLATATLLVQKYKDEEAILKKIIRTQKPKEVVPPQSNATSSTRTTDKPQTSVQPTTSGTSTTTIQGAQNVVIPSGNIVLGGVASGTGLATEATVDKIYKLLSVRKDGSYNSRIDELKKLIAAKEAEERKALENAQKKKEEEKKATDEAKQKVAEEKKATEEVKKKAVEEKKATDETTKKVTEEKKAVEAEKQKTQEAKKQTDSETKKTAESQKQVTLEQKETKTSQQNVAATKKVQISTKEFLSAIHKSYQEIAAGQRVFRERQFASINEIISESYTGLMAHASSTLHSDFDATGHMHPRNSMYSATDIASMAHIRRARNKYDTEVLITPDFVYKLEGLSRVSAEALDDLHQQFKQFEKANMNRALSTKAKESLLYYFAQDNGLSYSKHTYDATGKLTDITEQDKIIGKDIFAVLKEFVTVLQNKTHDSGESYKAWQNQKQSLMDKLKQDEMLKSLMLDSDEDLKQARLKGHASSDKMRSATLIQEAIDYDFDFSLFIPQFKRFFEAMSQLGEVIPPGSPLAKIKQLVGELDNLEVGSDAYKNLVGQIKTLSSDVFGKNQKPILDLRKGMIRELLMVAESDSSGKIVSTLKSEAKHNGRADVVAEIQKQLDAIKIDNSDIIDETSLEELKAELSRLEALRDSGEVDPRFATAEKQDVIIDILKNGVKIAGKGTNTTKDADDKTSKKKEETKKASQGQTIDTARKEVDAATGAASTTVKDTGDIITKTAQKCGAEILNITKTIKNGVESTTASINNDYEVAMKQTYEQISAKAGLGLFGKPYDATTGADATDAQAAVMQYAEVYNKLQGLIGKFKSLNLSTEAGKTEASKLQVEIDQAQKELDFFEDKVINIANNTEKFLGGKEAFSVMDTKALDQTGVSLKLLAQQTENAMVAFNGLYNDGTKLIYDVFDPASSTFKRYSLEVDKATGYVRKMETAQTGLVNAFQNVNKVQRQSADLKGIAGVNANANIVKQYNKARRELDKAVNDAWTKAKSENRLISLDEQKEIYAMSNEVLRLGKRILSTANSFKTFEAEGGQTFEVIRDKAESLESAMRRMAMDNALDGKMSIGNISYNDATKKLSYDLTDLDGNVRRVTMAYVDLFNQVKITSDNSLAAMDKVSAGINEDLATISNAVDSGLIDVRTKEYKEYEKELKEMVAYKDQLDAKDDRLTQNEIDNLNMRKSAVKALGEALVDMAKKNAVSMGQGSKDVARETAQKNTVDVGINNFSALANSKEYQKYITAYQEMINKQEEFKQNGILAGQSEQEQLSRMAKAVGLARGEFEQLARASAEFDAKIKDGATQTLTTVNYNTLSDQMKQFVLNSQAWTQKQREMIEQTWSFKNAQDGATYSVLKGTDQIASMSVIFDEGTRRIGQYTVETNKYKTGMEKFMDSLKGKWQEVARYLMTFGSFYQVLNVLRQGVTYVREIDSALTELKKVTDETEESYDRFLQTASKTASEVGSTIKDIVSSTADWSRLGFGMEEAHQLARSTSVLLNVSEFSSIEDATSALTSTLQAFGYTANDSMYVVDVLNEVGNNFAISSDGIATALQDSASSLMAANNSYEEAVALIAAANRVVILRHGL